MDLKAKPSRAFLKDSRQQKLWEEIEPLLLQAHSDMLRLVRGHRKTQLRPPEEIDWKAFRKLKLQSLVLRFISEMDDHIISSKLAKEVEAAIRETGSEDASAQFLEEVEKHRQKFREKTA